MFDVKKVHTISFARIELAIHGDGMGPDHLFTLISRIDHLCAAVTRLVEVLEGSPTRAACANDNATAGRARARVEVPVTSAERAEARALFAAKFGKAG
jgi:hypothetical protein